MSWPLRFVAAGGGEAGETRRLTLLDPVSGALREVDLRTVEVGTRVFADSADTDPASGEWFVAGRDTVRAWRVARSVPDAIDRAASPVRTDASAAWVDEDGRYLETELTGGLHMRRTAFELAFFRERR
jgi:hypothetical protein